MEKKDIEEIKNSVYELEGLLELAGMREDKIDDLLPLMKKRVDEITRLFGEHHVKEAPSAPTASAENNQYADPEIFSPTIEDVVEQEPAAEPTEKGEVHKSVKNQGKGKPAFCINDRFRFRRELFNNSDSEFNDAMTLIAGMDSYEEAEEYFIGELGWDPEDGNVADFLEIIRLYYL